jgi:hypothetical protein
VLALPVQLPERKPRAFARRVKCLPPWLHVGRGSVLSAPHSLQSKPRGFFLETSPCEERGCRGCAQVSPPWGTRSVLLCEARPRLPPCVALPCPAEWGGEQRSAPGSALPARALRRGNRWSCTAASRSDSTPSPASFAGFRPQTPALC